MPPSPVPPALEQLIADEHPRLVGALALYVGDVGVAGELAHEALIRLCDRWPAVSTMESPSGWLFTVAFNLARSRWRRLAAERRANDRLGRRPVSADVIDRDDVVVLRDAVVSLPPRQRMVVILRFYEDLSVADTAAVMRCAPGTVKSLTSHAVAALRSLVGPDLIDATCKPLEENEHV